MNTSPADLDPNADVTPEEIKPATDQPFALRWTDAVVAVCVYEVIAEAANAYLDEPLLPSVGTIVRRLSPKAALRRTPPWVATGAILSFGLILSIAAGARHSLRSM